MDRGPSSAPTRIAAVDALRGLVMLLLVPDLAGGFSFYRMAELHPGDAFWSFLGRQFSHAPWAGARLWDFVMPVFALLVGVSVSLSHEARSRRGEAYGRQLAHATVRSLALVALGLLLTMSVRSLADDLMPYVVIFALGVPVSGWLADLVGIRRATGRAALEIGWAAAVLSTAFAWLSLHLAQLGGYNLAHIFILLGLAYLPSFLVVRWSVRSQAAFVAVLLCAYGLAFWLFPAPGGPAAPMAAHWQPGTNLATALDGWLLAALPHAEPFRGEAHGYTTLQFVPLIGTLVAGMIAGRWLLAAPRSAVAARRLALLGLGLAGAGMALALAGVPLVKTLWTPSWALLSTGVALLPLAILHWACDVHGRHRWAAPLAVLGGNAVLLYTIAAHDRWRIVGTWQRVLGDALDASPWQPLLESLLVLGTLWGLAWFLHRRRLFVRL